MTSAISSTETFLDRPVTGHVRQHGRRSTPQRTAEEFKADLDTLLAVEHVTGVSWTQYTPYFNDGDPCEFGFGEVLVSLDIEVGPEYYEDYMKFYTASGDTVTLYDAYDVKESLPEVNQAITTFEKGLRAYEDVLHENLGDHAQVLATKTGFEVSEFHHE